MKRYLKYFLFYIITVISSVGAAVLVLNIFPVKSKVITETVNKTMINEQAIEEAISGVYDSVVTVVSNYGDTKIGTGSGFVYKKDDKSGYILTNNHVIESGNNFEVILQNGEEVEAKLLGRDSYSDLAVLSIDSSQVIKVSTLGDSDNIAIGNTVFTVGSPMGSEYSGSITRGIVSGKDRTIEADGVVTKVIQTDAAINPGNSGGPLVNLAGEVIGITSMKLADYDIEGMGFAIPINDAKVYVTYLEKGEKVSRPTMGVGLIDVTDRYRLYYYRISLNPNIKSGVVVAKIYENTTAASSDLRTGDVITKVNDNTVDSISKLRYYLYQYNIGDTVKLTVQRGTDEVTIDVKLEGE